MTQNCSAMKLPDIDEEKMNNNGNEEESKTATKGRGACPFIASCKSQSFLRLLRTY